MAKLGSSIKITAAWRLAMISYLYTVLVHSALTATSSLFCQPPNCCLQPPCAFSDAPTAVDVSAIVNAVIITSL